jgi:hypothetical protein
MVNNQHKISLFSSGDDAQMGAQPTGVFDMGVPPHGVFCVPDPASSSCILEVEVNGAPQLRGPMREI